MRRKNKQLLKKAINDYFNGRIPKKIEEDDLWRIKQNLRDNTYQNALRG